MAALIDSKCLCVSVGVGVGGCGCDCVGESGRVWLVL